MLLSETPAKPPLLNTSPISQLLIFVGLFFIFLGLAFAAGIILLQPLYGVSPLMLAGLIKDLENPLAIQSLKLLQFMQGLVAFIFPAFVMGWLLTRRPVNYLKMDKSAMPASYLWVLLLSLGAIPLINALGDWNGHMVLPEALKGVEQWMRESEDKAAKITTAFMNMTTFGDFIYIFTMVAVLPALGEELVFRGVIQQILKGWTKNVHVSILITAFIFSAIHMQFFGFIPRFMLGILLGYLFEWSGSLWLPILAHFVNNGSAVLFAFLARKQAMPLNPDKLGVEGSVALMVLLSAAVVGGLLYMVYKKEKAAEVTFAS